MKKQTYIKIIWYKVIYNVFNNKNFQIHVKYNWIQVCYVNGKILKKLTICKLQKPINIPISQSILCLEIWLVDLNDLTKNINPYLVTKIRITIQKNLSGR